MTCDRCGEELLPNTLHVCDELWPLVEYAPAKLTVGARSPGIGRIVVGYRPGDRRVQELRDTFGLEVREVRQCFAGCGYPVSFYSGGIDAVNERDAEVVCAECKAEFYPELMAAL